MNSLTCGHTVYGTIFFNALIYCAYITNTNSKMKIALKYEGNAFPANIKIKFMRTITIYAFAIMASAIPFSSCKKDYTCTCTTTISGISTNKVYDLPNQRITDANEACERFESDANSTGPGTTNCHL